MGFLRRSERFVYAEMQHNTTAAKPCAASCREFLGLPYLFKSENVDVEVPGPTLAAFRNGQLHVVKSTKHPSPFDCRSATPPVRDPSSPLVAQASEMPKLPARSETARAARLSQASGGSFVRGAGACEGRRLPQRIAAVCQQITATLKVQRAVARHEQIARSTARYGDGTIAEEAHGVNVRSVTIEAVN